MRKSIKWILLLCITVLIAACGGSKYKYESVPDDPLKTRIYTLDNGLKVYLSVNKDKPRVQANIAVRVGGKNDPAETTGLAHYFEHLMFKGTEQFGTQDYEKEKILLDKIEGLFEVYRKTTDDADRKEIYRQIDSISYEASKYAIPNEYDKLMAAIGASGTNAYTGMDMTVYTENIPSNEIENWAKIQSDRFQHNVIRGFHTELETVYEEKNMSLTSDGRKVYEATMAALFPHHPYGAQTVLGTQEHLKNPSIINIKNYYKQWYVPNNMAICMAGDFDPDEVMDIIHTYFGNMEPNNELPKLTNTPESPIQTPIIKEVIGLEAENITLAWRLPEARSVDHPKSVMLRYILSNGKSGLIDLNVNQQQKLLSASAYTNSMADYSMMVLSARPKQGQTLDEAKAILLAEVEKLRNGEFSEDLLEATVANIKLNALRRMEENGGRVNDFVSAFINDEKWEGNNAFFAKLAKLTKNDIMDFANTYLKDNNYAVIYKREGKDPNELKIDKPIITPIQTNRDTASLFLTQIQESVKMTKPIEPVFVDFSKDLDKLKAKSDIEVLYKLNTTNDLFSITYLFDMGTNEDKALGTAISYLDYLGTSTHTPEQIKEEFYKLACNYFVSSSSERVYVGLEGLTENMDKALELFESLLADAQPNEAVLENMKADILKSREDAKKNQSMNFRMLQNYAMYGPNSPSTNILSSEELKILTPEDLILRIKELSNYKHRILYYGPKSHNELLASVNKFHKVPEKLVDPVRNESFKMLETPENKVLIAPYDARQIYFISYSNRGEHFDESLIPPVTMYNEYFGGSMNSIVFQEMREARGLAYSASAFLSSPYRLDKPYSFISFIATQNDKMIDAMLAFDDIINNMPESDKSFNLAKEAIIANIRTQRIMKGDILWNYISAQDLGLNVDRRKAIFEQVPGMTFQDVLKFQQEWIKGRTYTYCVLGDEKELDMAALAGYGPIVRLTTEEIFGY